MLLTSRRPASLCGFSGHQCRPPVIEAAPPRISPSFSHIVLFIQLCIINISGRGGKRWLLLEDAEFSGGFSRRFIELHKPRHCVSSPMMSRFSLASRASVSFDKRLQYTRGHGLLSYRQDMRRLREFDAAYALPKAITHKSLRKRRYGRLSLPGYYRHAFIFFFRITASAPRFITSEFVPLTHDLALPLLSCLSNDTPVSFMVTRHLATKSFHRRPPLLLSAYVISFYFHRHARRAYRAATRIASRCFFRDSLGCVRFHSTIISPVIDIAASALFHWMMRWWHAGSPRADASIWSKLFFLMRLLL